MMCESEQGRKDRLVGQIVRLADDLGINNEIAQRLQPVMSLKSLQTLADEMDKRIAHRNAWQEEIANWYARKDKAGISTGD